MSIFLRVVLFVLVLILPAISAGEEQEQIISNAKIYQASKYAYPSTKMRPGGRPIEIKLPTGLKSEWVRLEFHVEHIKKGWHLEILSNDGSLIDVIPSNKLGKFAWSKRYNQETLWLRVPKNGVSTRLVNIMVHLPKVSRYSTIGDQNLYDVIEEDPGSWILDKAKGVVLLEIQGGNNQIYPCTGFVISPDLILTNEHCVNTDILAKRTEVYLDYISENRPDDIYRIAGLLSVNKTLDAAVLKLLTHLSNDRILKLSSADPDINDALVMIQQFEGKHQKISSDRDCLVKKIPARGKAALNETKDLTDYEAAFVHGCDTEDMSSGSPVISRKNRKVVGLHFWGKGGSRVSGNKATRTSKLIHWMKEEYKLGKNEFAFVVPAM